MIDILEFIAKSITCFFGIVLSLGLFYKWFWDKKFDISDCSLVLYAIIFLLFAFYEE